MSSKIYTIIAREILDSRGNPTVESTVIFESGYRGTASAPSGASVGKYEAVELRDGDAKRYNGMGVLKAMENVNNVIAPKLRGLDGLNQGLIDTTMIQLDGTPDKSRLGSNAIVSVSMANAVAACAQQRAPLYRYLNALFSTLSPTQMKKVPTPTFNIINGGKHGAGNLDFQEFQVVPASNKRFTDALRIGVETYNSLKKVLTYRNAVHSVGDEGGFAPNLFTNLDAVELLLEAIREAGYKFGLDVFIGLDVAASYFKTPKGYQIKDKPEALSVKDFIAYIAEVHKKYQLLLLEDALDQDDWEGWNQLNAALGKEILVIGDDFLATNPQLLDRAIAENACKAILAKPNQIGSLSEFLQVVAKAKKSGFSTIVSNRSGETNDSIIADLAVAVQSDYVKFGAPARGERVAKYNRLLQIETELFPQK